MKLGPARALLPGRMFPPMLGDSQDVQHHVPNQRIQQVPCRRRRRILMQRYFLIEGGTNNDAPLCLFAHGVFRIRLGGGLAFFVLVRKKSLGHPAKAQNLKDIKLGVHPPMQNLHAQQGVL